MPGAGSNAVYYYLFIWQGQTLYRMGNTTASQSAVRGSAASHRGVCRRCTPAEVAAAGTEEPDISVVHGPLSCDFDQMEGCGLSVEDPPGLSGGACPPRGSLPPDPFLAVVEAGAVDVQALISVDMEGHVSAPPELMDTCGSEINGQDNEDKAASKVQVDPSMSLITTEKAKDSMSLNDRLKAMDLHGSEEQAYLPSSYRLDMDTEENWQEAEDPQEPMNPLLAGGLRQECPICMEYYETAAHQSSLLHCNHFICDSCVSRIMTVAPQGRIGRISCPLCRQQTPMIKFEVLRMQEQMMENVAHCPQVVTAEAEAEAVVRRPGLCGALEYYFQTRFRSNPRFLFPPCFRYSPGFIDFTKRLQRRCRCAYRTLLCTLLLVEFASFFILFLPIAILGVLIIFLK